MNLAEAWKNFKTGNGPIFGKSDEPSSAGQNPSKPSPSVHVTLTPMASPMSFTLPPETQQAFIEAVAEKVPDLKKLLTSAALIAEDVPDFARRLNITMKQLKAAGSITNPGAMLGGLQQAVTSITTQLQNEVQEEERENITSPSEATEALKRQREQLQQQIGVLNDQIGRNELAINAARAALQQSQQKSQVGVNFVNSWHEQMQSLLAPHK